MNKKQNIKQRLTAVFLVLITSFAIFYGCDNEPDSPEPPTLADITVTGATPIEGKYQYSETLTLGGNTAEAGVTYAWTYTTVPAGKTLTFDQSAVSPAVNGFEKGVTYTFTLTATNEAGLTATKEATIAIAGNVAPTANAGTNFEHNITTSGTTVTLSGGGSDEDGTITSYAWTCTGYPPGAAVATFTSAAQNPEVSGFDKLGNYEFTLKVKDNDGAESVGATVTVSLVRTASAAIEVPSIAFSNNPILNFVQTYTGYNSDFQSGCVTYKVVDDKGHTWNDGEIVDVADTSLGYVHNEGITFTQTFYHGVQEVDSRSFKVRFSTAGGGTFNAIDVSGSWSPTGTIPSVSIPLNEKVTEGNIN